MSIEAEAVIFTIVELSGCGWGGGGFGVVVHRGEGLEVILLVFLVEGVKVRAEGGGNEVRLKG